MRFVPLLVVAFSLGACSDRGEPDELLSAGPATLLKVSAEEELSREAFSQPAPNLSLDQRATFAVGNALFTSAWLPAPASTAARDGLGPLFNAAACQSCHIKDGRGHPPVEGEAAHSFIVKLAGTALQARWGRQLQDRAISGIPAEPALRLEWAETPLRFADGEEVQLRRPVLSLDADALPPGAVLSMRVAPGVIGLGLLEQVAAGDLEKRADPLDRDGDGISGRVNHVPDLANGGLAAGRFGWKAAQPSVRQQSATALAIDMGLTSSIVGADDCTVQQRECRRAPNGGTPEISAEILAALDFYARHLAVPQRRWVDAARIRAGQRTFEDSGCASCHVPRWRTADAAPPELAGITIRPYTDLLLHDMGEGLADGVTESEADGREWRTPPLWGLHLSAVIAGVPNYLHDGRARTLMEAILWHGGEAQAARDRVLALPKAARENLVWFLKTL